MKMIRTLYHLMLADFRERVRRYNFVVVLLATIAAGYSMVPSISDPYNAMAIGISRPYYSSAWVGTVFGIVVTTLLTVLGFFLVREAVGRDYHTRVGQVIATTPVSKPVYILGKWLSNLAVFAVMLTVLTVVALIMQLVRAEDMQVDLWALAAPIWLMGLPTLALVAAFSLLAEAVPIPAVVGNIAFVGLWLWLMVVSVGPIIVRHGEFPASNDIAGVSRVMVDIRQTMLDKGLDPSEGVTDLYQPTGGRETTRFVWRGVSWGMNVVLQRLLWLGLAVLIALAASIPFDRFAGSRQLSAARRKKESGKVRGRSPDADEQPSLAPGVIEPAFMAYTGRMTALGERTLSGSLISSVRGELLLMLKARSKWWFIVTIGLAAACLFTPYSVAQRIFVPLLWLWPILVWSGMGTSEHTYGTTSLVFSSAQFIRRQLPAMWLAGVIVAATVTGAGALRFVIAGEWLHLFGWLVGVVFVPSLALAVGAWSSNARVFEMVYFGIWFVGVWGSVAVFDFIGRSGSTGPAVPISYAIIAAALIMAAVAGRKKQMMIALR